jgi:hypothetical protein
MSMVVWKERRRMLWDDGQWPRRRIGRVIGVGAACLAFAAFEYTATHGLGFFHKEPARQAEPTPKPVRVIEMAGPPNRKDQEPAPHEQAALVAVSPPSPVRQPVGRADPQAPSLRQAAPLDTKPTESVIEAEPPPTLPENESFAAGRDASTCFPSASAVRENHAGAWPSWTLRAPGHEGTRCWYAATRGTAHDHR